MQSKWNNLLILVFQSQKQIWCNRPTFTQLVIAVNEKHPWKDSYTFHCASCWPSFFTLDVAVANSYTKYFCCTCKPGNMKSLTLLVTTPDCVLVYRYSSFPSTGGVLRCVLHGSYEAPKWSLFVCASQLFTVVARSIGHVWIWFPSFLFPSFNSLKIVPWDSFQV